MALWWLSFAGPEGNRGIVILDGIVRSGDAGLAEATSEAWRRKLNPGGEILAWELAGMPEDIVPVHLRNRLIVGDEVKRLSVADMAALRAWPPPRSDA